MRARRLLLSLLIGCVLLISVFLFPGWQQFGPTTADAGIAGTVRYVANNGADADDCTNSGAPCRTLQHAVDSANAGDEIWMAAGVYTDVHTRNNVTQTVYIDKPLAVRGGFDGNWKRPAYDPIEQASSAVTVLDARTQGRVVFISGTQFVDTSSSTAANAVTLDRLDLAGGDATAQGGDPISGIYDAGGAIYASGGTVNLLDVFVSVSRAEVGGGATFNGSRVHLERTIFYSNAASYDHGGGVFLYDSPQTTILRSSFENNVSANAGGGLNVKYSDLTIGGTQFVHNRAYEGAGLTVYSSTLRMKRSYVFSNTASNVGGGIQLWQVNDARLDNSVIVENHAGAPGAGLDVYDAEAHMRHTTIANNTGSNGSIGLNLSSSAGFPGSSVAVTNTLIAGHDVGLNVDSGDTFAGEATLWWNTDDQLGSGTVITSANDVYAAPRFRMAPHDYRLRPFSPAVDAGVDAGLRADGEGDRRPYGGVPDIGADEVPYGFATPNAGWNFVYTDTEGISMTMDVPAGGVVSDTRIVFSRNVTPGHQISTGLRFAGVAFDLDAFIQNKPAADFDFEKPVTVSLRYRNEDVAGVYEQSLKLYVWTGTRWKDIAEDCGTTYVRDLINNTIYVPICHLSRWGIHGIEIDGQDGQYSERLIYLPAIVSNTP